MALFLPILIEKNKGLDVVNHKLFLSSLLFLTPSISMASAKAEHWINLTEHWVGFTLERSVESAFRV